MRARTRPSDQDPVVRPGGGTEGGQEINAAAQAHGSDDFEAFYLAQWQPMVRLAYLALGSRERAEDVVQDAFARVHLRWGAMVQPVAYLRAAVVNACRDDGRRLARYRHREPSLLEPEAVEDQPDELWDALSRLAPRQRAALVLRYYEGLQEPEIAEALGVRRGTVKSLLHRAIQQLREEIEP